MCRLILGSGRYSGIVLCYTLLLLSNAAIVWQGHRKFDLFAERDEGLHRSQRRLVSRIYSMDSLKDLEKYVDDAVKHFISKMEPMVGKSVDMGLFVQLFAFGTLEACRSFA